MAQIKLYGQLVNGDGNVLVEAGQISAPNDAAASTTARLDAVVKNIFTQVSSTGSSSLTQAKSYTDTQVSAAKTAAASDATTKADKALADAKTYADGKVAALGSVYRTKGSITAAGLKALTSAAVGDVYNVTDAVAIAGVTYPAGTNVLCVTAFSAAVDPNASPSAWDALSGLQDLSAYALKTELVKTADITQNATQANIKLRNTSSGSPIANVVIAAATSTAAGVMSAADKAKLDGVAAGANKYVLPVAGNALGGVLLYPGSAESTLADSGLHIHHTADGYIFYPYASDSTPGLVKVYNKQSGSWPSTSLAAWIDEYGTIGFPAADKNTMGLMTPELITRIENAETNAADIKSDVADLMTRVSALEDLLKLA